MTRDKIESALAAGVLWAAMRNGRYWVLRRNGATQTWKRDGRRFSIPVKCGLKSCSRITETDTVRSIADPDWRSADFVVSAPGVDPNRTPASTMTVSQYADLIRGVSAASPRFAMPPKSAK